VEIVSEDYEAVRAELERRVVGGLDDSEKHMCVMFKDNEIMYLQKAPPRGIWVRRCPWAYMRHAGTYVKAGLMWRPTASPPYTFRRTRHTLFEDYPAYQVLAGADRVTIGTVESLPGGEWGALRPDGRLGPWATRRAAAEALVREYAEAEAMRPPAGP
jgi:hypothetical protein